MNVNVVRKWKRIMAVGCSHGAYADPVALKAVLKFREKSNFDPHTVVHLGDFTDLSCFMSSAKGSSSESEEIQPDVDGGLTFLEALRPTLVLCGNHEDRLWRLQHSSQAIVAHAARDVIEQINSTCKELGAELLPYTGIEQGRTIGGHFYTHGTVYGENCTRDMAEMYGNVVHAHTHRCAVAKGRRSDKPTGYCVGTLTRRGAFEYSKTRRSTMAWSQGLIFGEYCDNQSQLYLHEQPSGLAEWRLPK